MYNLRKIVLVSLTLTILGTTFPGIASDTDAPPFLIYVDPETGKYTKKKPEHVATPEQPQQTSSVTNTPRQVPSQTKIFPVFIIAGGVLLGSHLLSRIFASTNKSS
jgi:hypothetical protein